TTYYELLQKRILPIFRGKLLTAEDLVRRFVIERLMCDFMLDKEHFLQRFGFDFDSHFCRERQKLQEFVTLRLVEESEKVLRTTAEGELFIRNIASCFDWYFAQKEGHKQFSKAI